VIRATANGLAAREVWCTLPSETEAAWRRRIGHAAMEELIAALTRIDAALEQAWWTRFGATPVERLRRALRPIVTGDTGEAFLAAALTVPDGGSRATQRRPTTLP
jgi:hypothetical protein